MTSTSLDSHSRNECGIPCAEGKAVLTGHSSLNNLISFVRHLASVILPSREECFEITHVLLTKKWFWLDCFSDFESEFSGFSTMSEGEYACKLCLIEELKNQILFESELSFISDSDDTKITQRLFTEFW